MKKVFLMTTVFLCINSYGQKTQKKYESIEYAVFVPDKNNGVKIDSYIKVFDKNKVHYKFVDSIYNTEYFNSISNHEFILTDSQCQTINNIFNGKTSLKTYLKIKKLEKGTSYLGLYSFIKVRYSDNSQDSLCFVDFFLRKDFSNVITIIHNEVRKTKSLKKIPVPVPILFKNHLLRTYKNCKYLPKIETLMLK